jgi:amino acid adenylation domain-containing protein
MGGPPPGYHRSGNRRLLRHVLATVDLAQPSCGVLLDDSNPIPEPPSTVLKAILDGPVRARSFTDIAQAIEQQALLRPDAIAVRFGEHELSYRDLNRRSNQLGRHLSNIGVSLGSKVGLCMDPCVEFIVGLLAVLKLGCTHVPLEPGYPKERLELIANETELAIVLTQRALSSSLEYLDRKLLQVDFIESVLTDFDESNLGTLVPADTIAYIIYTSGTTGTPKGVMISYANLAHYIDAACSGYGYGPRDVIPSMARFTFSITFFELLSPLVTGAQLLLLERGKLLDMPSMVQTLREVTCIHASPSWWRKLVSYIDGQDGVDARFSQLRHISSGGDMVPADLLESLKRLFVGAEVFVIYGCSEISCMGCSFRVPRERSLERTYVGLPFPNMGVRLLDSSHHPVPLGVVGEVHFRGDGLAAGYLNRPELTQERFLNVNGERLYHTGDLGRIDPSDGHLELIGRSDFQIQLRGIRIEPSEIEAHVRKMPGVQDAAIAAPFMQDGERQLVCYVVSASGGTVRARELRDFLKVRLPDYMVPSVYVALDTLPVNVNQKLDRLALAKLPTGVRSLSENLEPARTLHERQLLEVWQNILGIEIMGVNDSFFDVGGDSLRAVTLMTELERRWGLKLPVTTILGSPTIRQLAQWFDPTGLKGGTSEASSICLRKGADGKLPIFFIHDGNGETIPYFNLAQKLANGHSVYGIHPKHSRQHPMLHTRMTDMVEHYAAQIQAIQPEGPYFLGGLCIGGFLAFETGRLLRQRGAQVGPIILLDAAHVGAIHNSVLDKRLSRLSEALQGATREQPLSTRLVSALGIVARRSVSVIRYEISARTKRHLMRSRIRLLRYYLDHKLALPRFLSDIPVDAILRFAEREYHTPDVYPGELLLFRATKGRTVLDGLIDDTPYMELFKEPMLGWTGKATSLTTYDINAGHSSMLQEPEVGVIAAALQPHISAACSR